jgi:hypothetical protein
MGLRTNWHKETPMTDLPDYPGAPSLDMLAETTFSMMQLTMMTSRQNAAAVKFMQALVQDLAARDPEIVDRLKRVFEISNILPDIAPDVKLILSGITRPDDPRAIHEDDAPASAH